MNGCEMLFKSINLNIRPMTMPPTPYSASFVVAKESLARELALVSESFKCLG